MSNAARATQVDAEYMRRALALAARGWGQTAPNPMVGAVVVAADVVVGEGYHARYGESHAEVVALRAAGDAARGATLYVTLEPCAHFGKTPPCVDAIVDAGIARVVAAARDPSDIARGGVERLRASGIAVDLGSERHRALELNAPFFNAHASARPWVTLKLAVSADWRIADPSGLHRWITGVDSRHEVHRLRANSDAIAVGIGTVLADDPSLTVRDAPAPRVAPRRVVFDSSLRAPFDSVLVRTAREIETILIARDDPPGPRRDALEAVGVRIIGASNLGGALASLRALGIRSLFVEGGARLAGSMLAADLVDRLVIFQSPTELGDTALGAFDFAPQGFAGALASTRVVEEGSFGPDRMTVYALHEVPCSPD
ncbi:MAG TPA: bifunctional diaminohydroxyphosphoribosylaminopyrimidine deaminase/5-amino-6-(5-phosphoribosylamino)uracil reductase RibD [Gemmatimonadaceae bacterium]|nr:bifunctional diaminohydroxyphosphoribosylaminopyrimidine deaminase/5-amino-6-(5-phosphoribosylamino)uracil reductase RibD [Gemmatimonadaceae bacterium]